MKVKYSQGKTIQQNIGQKVNIKNKSLLMPNITQWITTKAQTIKLTEINLKIL